MNKQEIVEFWHTFNTCEPYVMTDGMWAKAKHMAESWHTCACGTLSELVADMSNGPEDEEMRNLGIAFSSQCEAQMLENARRIFKQINQRESILLKRLGVVKLDTSN